MTENQKLLDEVIGIARRAGVAIMDVYRSDKHGVEKKADDSPITLADKAANDIIVTGLRAISRHDVISEENEHRQADAEFWLVDPLDGTKEFINRNGEFTVNIALIKRGRPVMGVVYAPDKDTLYAGSAAGAFKHDARGRRPIRSIAKDRIPAIATSRSHKDDQTIRLLKKIGRHTEINIGSSLKLCLVAEGSAMLYPRLAPTWLWDTAAGDAVVRAAGGHVRDPYGNDLIYDPKVSMKNPFFVAATADSLDWQPLLVTEDAA